MRRWLQLLLFSSMAFSQSTQTPRQALLEILKATSTEQIDKHTPEVLLGEMKKIPPEARQREQQSMIFFSMLMQSSPDMVQTFESGPTFMVIRNAKENTRAEITVERDDLAGDTDTLEFGIQFTKEGRDQGIPFDPRVLIEMKLEKNVWRLSRIGASANLQLDDPKVAAMIAKSVQEQWDRQKAVAAANADAPRTTAEANLVGALRTLNTAEVTYSATYTKIGFTCRLSDLGGSLSGRNPDEHGAQLINPALESGVRYSYRIEIAGCEGTPANLYRIVATPTQKGLGHRTYCTDQTAVIRSVEEAASAECLSRGKPIN